MGGSNTVPAKVRIQNSSDYSEYKSGVQQWCMNKTDVAEIRFAKTGLGSEEVCPAMTLPEMLRKAVANHGDKPALRVERPLPKLIKPGHAEEGGPAETWKTWTYKEYHDEAMVVAQALVKLGVERCDGVNILGFNSPEWFIGLQAAAMAGAICAGVYPSDTPDQIKYKCQLSDSSVALVDSIASLGKYKEVVDDVPYLKAVVCWSDEEGLDLSDLKRSDGSTVRVLSWEDFLEIGRAESAEEVERRVAALEPGACACLVFTSGTTGNPKAVMISHDNVIFEAFVVVTEGIPMLGAEATQERIISYLPLCHVAGMMVDIIAPCAVTAFKKGWTTSHFARPYDLKAGTIGFRLKAVKPTLFLGVPRVWEKIADKIKAMGANSSGLKSALVGWAKGHGLQRQESLQVGKVDQTGLLYPVANVLLKKIKKALGLDECKFMFSGAAPMRRATLEFYGSLGINVNEVYGMSECSGATTWSTDQYHVWGSIGYELGGSQVGVFKVSDSDVNQKEPTPVADDLFNTSEEEQGELLFRGRHIMMGYLANPKLGPEHVAEMEKKNADAIDKDGWLHSGDKAALDKRGVFKITGRYKELIIGAGGENVAPLPIEDSIKKLCPYVANAMMVGDKRKFNVILITLKTVGATGELPGTDELDKSVSSLFPKISSLPEAMKHDDLIQKITDAITATNNSSAVPSNAAKVQKFTILPSDFSVQTGELTPSLKLKRSVVESKQIDVIEKMYASKDAYVPYN